MSSPTTTSLLSRLTFNPVRRICLTGVVDPRWREKSHISKLPVGSDGSGVSTIVSVRVLRESVRESTYSCRVNAMFPSVEELGLIISLLLVIALSGLYVFEYMPLLRLYAILKMKIDRPACVWGAYSPAWMFKGEAQLEWERTISDRAENEKKPEYRIRAVAKEKQARKYIPECPSFCRHEDDRTSLYKLKISYLQSTKTWWGNAYHPENNEKQPS